MAECFSHIAQLLRPAPRATAGCRDVCFGCGCCPRWLGPKLVCRPLSVLSNSWRPAQVVAKPCSGEEAVSEADVSNMRTRLLLAQASYAQQLSNSEVSRNWMNRLGGLSGEGGEGTEHVHWASPDRLNLAWHVCGPPSVPRSQWSCARERVEFLHIPQHPCGWPSGGGRTERFWGRMKAQLAWPVCRASRKRPGEPHQLGEANTLARPCGHS